MATSKWRLAFRALIQQVLEDTRGQSKNKQNAALRKAFPCGARVNHPYQMWLKEVRFQRGLARTKQPKGTLYLPGQLDFLPMNEQEALLAEISKRPNDPTPRAIYADWLEDHGEVEAAELYRVVN